MAVDDDCAFGRLTGESHDVGLFLVQLRVEHLVRNLAHRQHFRQHFRNFDRGRTDQTRSSGIAHLFDFVDDGTIFFAIGLIDAVFLVVADDGLVRRNLDNIEFVNIPEFACLGDGRTRHTSQFVVHTEVVLQRNRGECLRGCLHLHVFLRLDGLMQSVAPTATLHNTACLLIDNLHFAVDDDIFVVLVEHTISLEQLANRVDALRLHGIVVQQIVFLIDALFLGERGVGFESGKLRGDVGQHEEIAVVHLLGEPFGSLVGQFAGIEFFLDHEIKRFDGLGHPSVVVFHIDFLGFQHTGLDAFLGKIFDERLVLRQALVRAVEREETSVERLLTFLFLTLLHQRLALADERLGLGEILSCQLALHTHELFDERLIFLEHLVVALRHGTADDQRRASVIDQHRVHLIDDGIVVGALHEVVGRRSHIVAQIVETELVVRSEGDVSIVGTTTRIGIGLMLVDAIDAEAVELVERSHPFRVTLGQIVVHRDDVNAVARQCVEEHGQRCHQRFTLTRRHFRDFSLMQGNTAEQLHVVVNHLPFQVVAACRPVVVVDGFVAVDGDEVFRGIGRKVAVEIGRGDDGFFVLGEASSRFLHDAEGDGHHFIEGFLVDFECLFV